MTRITPSRRLAPALLLAVALAATVAPATAAPPAAAVARPAAVLADLDEWNWDAFVKFWKKQLGKTTGVVGVVALVALGATLLILSKGRGN